MRRVFLEWRGLWSAVLLCGLLLGAGGAWPYEVTFPDPNLEQAVRTAINKPSGAIQNTDLVGVNFSTLNATFKGIVNLAGLEECTDLRELQLYGNGITDITPLASLPLLRDLYAWENQIADLSPLSGLANLRFLFLHSNHITDLAPLTANAGIGSGDIVNVTGNPLLQSSLCSAIPELSLRGVTIYHDGECGTLVVDIPDPNLETMVRRTLGIVDRDIYDVDMAQLDTFDASDSGITDLTGLEYAVNLERLYLGGNSITDLGPLSLLAKIDSLYLGGNQIRDLTPLRNLYGVIYLELQDNELTNLDGLEYMGGMVALFLHDNHLTDASLQSMEYMLNLRVLNLAQNQFTSVAALSNKTRLISLDIGGNAIADIAPLSTLTKLERLGLWDNEVTSLAPLANMTELFFLDASYNTIADISVLAGLRELAGLILDGNLIRGLSSLAGLPQLALVSLRDNKISDISPLVANTGLGPTGSSVVKDYVDLRGNQLSQENLCNDIPTLLARDVRVVFDGSCQASGTTYQLVMSVQGEGSVEPPAGTRTYAPGTEVTIEAAPAEGWIFDRWEGDETGSQNPITVTMDRDKRITAVFLEATGAYTLTVTTEGSGTTTPTGETSYSEGVQVKVTATPAAGWLFDHWEGDVPAAQQSLNPITLTMDADKAVKAVFVEQGPLYPVTTAVIGNGIVELDPLPEDAEGYPTGTGVRITATADLGWVFDHWEGDVPQGAANPYTLIVDEPKAVTAVFVADGYDYTLATVVQGAGSVVVTPKPPLYSDNLLRYRSGAQVTVLAVAGPGFVFDHWTGDLAGEMNPAPVTMDRNKTITAVFLRADVTYTLTIEPITDGPQVNAVYPPAGAYSYAVGRQVNLQATAGLGWSFDHWEGDLQGDAGVAVITMDEDKVVKAVFAQAPYVTQILPGAGYEGGGDNVAIVGGRLATASQVLFGGEAADIVSANDSLVIVRTPAHSRGIVDVVVMTNLGDVRVLGGFKYVELPGPPELGSFAPNKGRAAGGDSVLIRGRNLELTQSVHFGGQPALVVQAAATRLHVVTPPHAPGFVDVTVTTTTGTDTATAAFEYLAPPQITAITPSAGYIAGGDTVTISGTALDNLISVLFGTAQATVLSVSPTTLQVVSPGQIVSGPVDVLVTTSGGETTAVDGFDYFSETSTILCEVRNAETQLPITDATVRLDPVGVVIQNSGTGTYIFFQVRPGSYAITASAPNYIPQTRDVTSVEAQQVGITFLLEPTSNPDSGPCGMVIDRLFDKVREESMPLSVQENPLNSVSCDSALAVRVTSDEAVDPESVWAVAQGEEWMETGGAWIAANSDNTDGWVVFTSEIGLPAGQTVTLTVGGVAESGALMEPISRDFAVDAPKAVATAVGLVESTTTPALPDWLAAGRSPAYRIEPAGVYSTPVAVQIPIPEGIDPANVRVYYYSEAVSQAGWYVGENVIGWLVPDSVTVVEVDGQACVQFSANHSGVVQLGQPLEAKMGGTTVELGAHGPRGMLISFAIVLLALSISLGLIWRKGNRIS